MASIASPALTSSPQSLPPQPSSAQASTAAAPTAPIPAFVDPGTRRPTRVVVASLGIDLPVVEAQGHESFPLCDVAEFLPSLSRPGIVGVTYLYAHARRGMFLPLLSASNDDPDRLLGLSVVVYTADRRAFEYRVAEVRRHLPANVDSIRDALTTIDERLWLQTSEGPQTSSTKLIVIGRPVGELPRPGEAASHPAAHPRACG